MLASVPSFGVITINNAVPIGCTSPLAVASCGTGRYMGKALLAVAVPLLCISLAHAQTDVLIEIDRGRTEGVFTKSPVFQRAILAEPPNRTDTAVACFLAYADISTSQSVAKKHGSPQPVMTRNQQRLAGEGSALRSAA